MSANGLIPVWRGVYIHYFKINPPHFLLSCLFWKLSQPLGQDKKIANKHTVAYWLSYFYGFLRAFLSRVFLEFSPKFVYSTMVAEKFIVLRLLQIHLRIKTLNLFIFTHAPKQNSPPGFYHYPQAERNCAFFPDSIFWKYSFLIRKRGERVMDEKITKINNGIGHKFW